MLQHCSAVSATAGIGLWLARDFNAPPYQERLASGEVPPCYHYVSEHYTLNDCENPRYQPNNQRIQNYGYLEPNNQQGTQFEI